MPQFTARSAIAAMGHDLGPDILRRCMALYAELQNGRAAGERCVPELAYGEDPRHRLDLYLPARSGPAPVLLFVHGGGFVRGDKRAPDNPFNAHVGRYAAERGFVGAVMNYRLAPSHRWPAGGDDVGRAIDWLVEHAATHGGDPTRIVACGTSAGAVHVATYLRQRGRATPLRGAILLSGLYGETPLAAQDRAYLGEDATAAVATATGADVAALRLPLLVACAEFDPPRFHAEMLALWRRIYETRGHLPRGGVVSGHNHYTMPMHLGAEDSTLGAEIESFIRDVTA